MGLFGLPKDLSSKDMKKVIDQLHADAKGANGNLPSLHHAVAAAMGTCGYKCLPDSKLVEAAVREICTYGMPREKRDMQITDWWAVATSAERIAALDSTSQCLQ
jgi:hypothetical protein